MNAWQKIMRSLRPRTSQRHAENAVMRMSTIRIAAVSLILSLWGAVAYAGTHHYYYTDPQGTVLARADASGAIIATYDYAPYGTAVASMSPAPNGPGYTGHVNDPDTGLVYMQARYYDPSVGRFLSADPVTPSPGNTFNFNRYNYTSNNPINHIDPDGRCADGASCDQMVQSYGAWANANPAEADKIGRDVGVPGVTVMLAVTGAPEAAGVASVIRAVAGKIVSAIARRAAKDVFTEKGGVKGAEKEFKSASGNEISTGKEGVRVKMRSNGERIEMHDSTGKNPNVPKGTRTIKVQDQNGKVVNTYRYPEPKPSKESH
jgi:RHS repeat-associated protein